MLLGQELYKTPLFHYAQYKGGTTMPDSSQSAAEFLAQSVLAIRESDELRQSFIRVLSIGSASQQVRVTKLREAVTKYNPPREVLKFIDLLGNDQLAHEVLRQLQD